jgi:hypothetical protein
MRPESEQGKTNRRGCFVFAVLIPLIVLLLVAISLGWLGQVERGKITDLPVPGGNQS